MTRVKNNGGHVFTAENEYLYNYQFTLSYSSAECNQRERQYGPNIMLKPSHLDSP